MAKMFAASRKVERYGPLAAGLAVAMVFWGFLSLLIPTGEPGARPPNPAHYLGLGCSVLCGLFSIRAWRLNLMTVANMEGSPVMHFADRTGYREDIEVYLRQDLAAGSGLLLWSGLVVVTIVMEGVVPLIQEAVLLGAFVWATLTGYRNLALMKRLVARLADEAAGRI